jgi:hypothetical protein
MTCIVMAITIPSLFFFPAAIGYISYGVGKTLALGFFERLPERDPLLDEEDWDEAGAELRQIDYGEILPRRRLPFRLPIRRLRRGARRREQRRPEPPTDQTKGDGI